MWTLIITASILAAGSQSGHALDVEAVYGFKTYEDCVKAGNQVPSPPSKYYAAGKAMFVCVSMGEKK